ncbi:cuticle protein 19.8-like [Anopheles ziemanni]|uniref:cuticle protein 19.8-like n=1 Tax=Anopheles coustani TaxID=139045 RepID=UPI00265A376D|nr:cuticle protein 19.8-like [Anopheles coustani]XP_058169255.1 cuticle protein 19.8-like [Anopheles ziemanni]
MSSKISLISLGLLLVVACSNAQLGARRSSQDRVGVLRQYDDGLRASRNFDDLYDEQRFTQGNRNQQEQEQRQDRRDRTDYDSNDDSYSYGYAVRDEVSGDIKSQQEVRNGDRVRGQYRTVESDGTERIVDYTADDFRGFNAIVRHQPPVAKRTQLVHTLQPAVLLRPAHVAQVVSANSAGHRSVPSATVLLHH